MVAAVRNKALDEMEKPKNLIASLLEQIQAGTLAKGPSLSLLF